jgi:GH24 family phage-related lysozyme (muramidase)
MQETSQAEPSVATQWDFTAPHEGVVPHLYLDSRGLPTCGVGFLIPNAAALQRLQWSPSCELADYQTLIQIARDNTDDFFRSHTADFYRNCTSARLSDAAMRAEFDQKVTDIQQLLARLGWQLDRQPAIAQLAIVDMAYNLGVGRLAKFDKFRKAVAARAWNIAADESSRIGVSAARNAATAAAFRSCVQRV